PITNVPVASFTTTYTGNVAGDFVATINWGDGTTSAGTISGSGGNFVVTGTHTYTSGGNDTFVVTGLDDPPRTPGIPGTGTATINFSGQMVLGSQTEHVPIPINTTVATFSDNNLGDVAASFTAQIDWGDGSTSPGIIVGSSGSFSVQGGHTYADEGNDQ